MSKSPLEKKIQADIEADLGAEPDLLLLRNSIGMADYFDEETGKAWKVPYGLGTGSPDLVGILMVYPPALVTRGGAVVGRSKAQCPEHWQVGRWFCLEVKSENGVVSPEQEKCHAIWRRFGAFIEVVRSVAEARAALERARA